MEVAASSKLTNIPPQHASSVENKPIQSATILASLTEASFPESGYKNQIKQLSLMNLKRS